MLGMLTWLFFPGPAWLAQRYRLRGCLAPFLYILLHPLFVVWQGFLGLHDLVRSSRVADSGPGRASEQV